MDSAKADASAEARPTTETRRPAKMDEAVFREHNRKAENIGLSKRNQNRRRNKQPHGVFSYSESLLRRRDQELNLCTNCPITHQLFATDFRLNGVVVSMQ